VLCIFSPIRGTDPPEQCNGENDSKCCVSGTTYATYHRSPPVNQGGTEAILTLNSFAQGGDGGSESECDQMYHENTELIVALSTGWLKSFPNWCNSYINISRNEKSVVAKVVDECNSAMGCDEEHAYQPPCRNNIVDASSGVWKALGVDESSRDWGEMEITWSDA
jgi:hypothetical protein